MRRAARKGFAAIALTDHDTVRRRARSRARSQSARGIELIPACELSTLDDNERQIDILAYGIDIDDVEFRQR